MFQRHLILKDKLLRFYYTVKRPAQGNVQNDLAKHIYQRIKTTGPITVANYMKEVLINPVGGYYMHRDMFGRTGDFITSPELNQMFGEMVAVWCLNEWSKMGCPKPFQVVEFGPGKGSLSEDILRIFKHFKMLKDVSLSLVEVSPYLSEAQSRTLCVQSSNIADKDSDFYKEGLTRDGLSVKWYRDLNQVPKMFSIYVAHEFFDALPIHKFQKTEEGYKEVLIDIKEDEENKFRYVLSRGATPASKIFIKPTETRDHFEISPETILLCKAIASRIVSEGGLCLVADYGHDGDGTDTFRAFKKHKQQDPLSDVGNADLTADVDFSILKEVAVNEENAMVFGPVTQRSFLLSMGIEHRFKALREKSRKEEGDALEFGYNMMIEKHQMGERFKFLSIHPAVMASFLEKYPVAGFS